MGIFLYFCSLFIKRIHYNKELLYNGIKKLPNGIR